jgi:asparagine synthase (glutamine-hydrolysing)
LANVGASTLAVYRPPSLDHKRIPPWLQPALLEICRDDVRHYAPDIKRSFSLKPSDIFNSLAWWTIVETLPHHVPETLARYEYRYPYLDRDLVEYLFSVPREQLVRPGRRRSLMRRALIHILPTEILERRRKAFIVRGPLDILRQKKEIIDDILRGSWCVDHGFVDPIRLRSSLTAVLQGHEPRWWPSLVRLISFELWMRVYARRQWLAPFPNGNPMISGPGTGPVEIRAFRAGR